MGLLEDLLKTIQEAAEEARNPGGTRQRPALDTDLAQSQARIQAKAEAAARERQAEAERMRSKADRQRAADNAEAPPEVPFETGLDALRIRSALRDPVALRDLMVLREIIDRPVALRHGRR